MNIEFADEEVHKLFCEMSFATEHLGAKSLGQQLVNLMRWQGRGKMVVMKDFIDKSFTFQEVWPDGSRGIFGGIVCHKDAEGGVYYAIHT